MNISCPNVADEFGTPFAADAEIAAGVTEAVKAAVGASAHQREAGAQCALGGAHREGCRRGGRGCDQAVNTMPGMVIDADAGNRCCRTVSGESLAQR